MNNSFNRLLFKEKLIIYMSGDYFKMICCERNRRLLFESLGVIKSDGKQILKLKKSLGDPNIPEVFSSSESEQEEDVTNDRTPLSDVSFNTLVPKTIGVLDQFYVELPRKLQRLYAMALLYALEVPPAVVASWNVGL